jgi:hypothetical protein
MALIPWLAMRLRTPIPCRWPELVARVRVELVLGRLGPTPLSRLDAWTPGRATCLFQRSSPEPLPEQGSLNSDQRGVTSNQTVAINRKLDLQR